MQRSVGRLISGRPGTPGRQNSGAADMSWDRRTLLAAGLAAPVATLLPGCAATAMAQPGVFPNGFLWGAATAGHQIEGNDVNSDYWLMENVQPTLFVEPVGDACDSYHRYEADADLVQALGFNCLRMSLEWSRIEPEPGAFSIAELDHYKRVLEALRERGIAPFITFNHFALPRWFAARGGFEQEDAPELFARYVERATRHLGHLMHAVATFNQPNLIKTVFWRKNLFEEMPVIRPMLASAARACGSDRFVPFLLGDQDKMQPILKRAHMEAMAAAKSVRSDLPIGVTLIMQHDEVVDGPGDLLQEMRRTSYDDWLAVAAQSDFVGVQIYTRGRLTEHGDIGAPEGAETTQMGYEFYPQAVGPVLRYAAEKARVPIYITENGIGTEDDARRIAYTDRALADVEACLREGVDVRGYLHWSLMDNFEWLYGYRPKFGLVSVDRSTFERTPKPSALHLGAIARRNRAYSPT